MIDEAARWSNDAEGNTWGASSLQVILWTFVGCAALSLLLIGFVAMALTASVDAMSDPNLRLEKADESRHRELFAAAAEHHDWARDHDFDWIGAFLVEAPQRIFVAAWRQSDAQRYFCIYTHAHNDYYDFVTRFDDDHGLTTSGSMDAHTLPMAPGRYLQSFDGADHEELWERHLEAEEYLTRNEGVRLATTTLEDDFPSLVVRSIHEQMKYVKSLPLWRLRVVLWFLVRGRKSNHGIERQLSV